MSDLQQRSSKIYIILVRAQMNGVQGQDKGKNMSFDGKLDYCKSKVSRIWAIYAFRT